MNGLGGGSTILVVDDNPNNLGVLSDFLAEEGFEILVARDGKGALQRVDHAIPDLILLDIMMPGMDGFEACRQLKAQAHTADIPIIFMTALTDTSDKVQGLSLGAVDYVTKPFQKDEVLARIRLHLKLRSLTLALQQQNDQLQTEITEREAAELALMQLNQQLEERVRQRTQDLSTALDTLKQTQTQLVQGEKLAALGQLVAGVAHEINNPVNFIFGNIGYADGYVQNLLELLALYRQALPDPSPEIQDIVADVDLDFLQEDLPKVFSSMKLGADRIRAIIQSLRNFSRLDEALVQAVNLHEGIDSTLMILQNRLKAKPNRGEIQVIKAYGDIPPVECYAGQINQVFMNLLVNAIDALEEAIAAGNMAQRSPQITITTSTTPDQQVCIAIADNGSGIQAEQQSTIFEPFFTTKPVGKGTGLGLAISHEIITATHQGSLACISEWGQGTEFVIQIPLQLQGSAQRPAVPQRLSA